VLRGAEDTRVLGLRLDGYGHDQVTLNRIAADIVRWGDGKRMLFVTELDPEVDPDVRPSPIMGSVREALMSC
jgi:hypothetical protein